MGCSCSKSSAEQPATADLPKDKASATRLPRLVQAKLQAAEAAPAASTEDPPPEKLQPLCEVELPASEDQIPKDKARYDLKDPIAFAKFLQTADVKLVRARYLADLLRRKQPLPRRQEAELETFVSDGRTETALVSHEEVKDWSSGTRDAIVCSVSHAWETREHPDPCRYQLQWVVDRALLYQAAFRADVWIFYDYVSLFQYQRDPESHEQRSFEKSMDNMHVMYAHEFNLTFRISTLTPDKVWEAMKKNEQELVPVWDAKSKSIKGKPLKDLMENRAKYEDRGWCKAEVEWSSLRTLNAQHQRIDGSELDAFNSRVPMTPESFKETMRKAEFTHRSDADAVIQLQEKIFFEKVTACETLVLEGVPATEIEALARALPLYTNMTHLTINKFRCGEREANFLAEALAKTTSLVTFEACNGDGESGKHMAKALAEALKVNSSITKINLARNNIGEEGVKALAQALEVNSSIVVINLAYNHIGEDDRSLYCKAPCNEGVKALAQALEVNSSIVDINLEATGMGKEGAKALATALKVNTSITKINFAQNHETTEGLQALRAAAAEDIFLKFIPTFDPFGVWIKGAEEGADNQKDSCRRPLEAPIRIKALAEVLKANTCGAQIKFRNMDHLGGEALGEALIFNISVTDIDFSCTQISNKWALAEALKFNSSITNITLNHCTETEALVEALAEALKVNSSIRSIKCIGGLGDKGAKALAEALRVNSFITNINLECNQIGDQGAKALAEALKVNSSIAKINLEANYGIGRTGTQALMEAVEERKKKGGLDLEINFP